MAAAVSFAAVLCLKHTFVYAAPVYAVVLLRRLPLLRLLGVCAAGAGGECSCECERPWSKRPVMLRGISLGGGCVCMGVACVAPEQSS